MGSYSPDPGLRLIKAHGTANDFLVLVDPQGGHGPVPADTVAALCDRRRGVGADGMIRAVRADADPRTRDLVEGPLPGGVWFMDYTNSDGSPAQMCGNGIRVMAEVLAVHGLVEPEVLSGTSPLRILTRSGLRSMSRELDGDWTVEMGPVAVGVADGSVADAAPGDAEVDTLVAAVGLGPDPRPGLRVDVGNPHVVVAVVDDDELRGVDLREAPALRPASPGGVNVEFVHVVGRDDRGIGHLAMRVHERGSGETQSCGTGAVAAAAAAAAWAGSGAPRTWTVDVPGGRLRVQLTPEGTATLSGPVTIVAVVELAGVSPVGVPAQRG